MSTVAAGAVRPPQQRRWLVVWSEAWRIGLCIALGLVYSYSLWNSAAQSAISAGHLERLVRFRRIWIVDIGLTVLFAPLIHWRRSHPHRVALVLLVVGMVSNGIAAALALALMTIAERRRPKEIACYMGLWLASMIGNDSILTPPRKDGTVPILSLPPSAMLSAISLLLLAYLVIGVIGWSRGARDRLAESWRVAAELAQREQMARVAQAQTAERARIAREMHDVLAHKISLISLHAGVLAYQRDNLTTDEIAETANLIRGTAHQALEELREVLGVLRADDVDPTAPPQPSLLDLPRLVAQEEAAGARVTLCVEDGFWQRASEVAPSTARHAHRIIQECLTNARKHASQLPVHVTVGGDEETGLVIEVRNPLGDKPSDIPGAGLGLAGLKERAALSGGQLQAEVEGSEFTVRAQLPWKVRIGS